MAAGSSVGHSALVVALVLAACGVTSCQDGYPIPPTRCDYWCQAAQHECWIGMLSPASCVTACEQQGLGQDKCADTMDRALACMRQKPATDFDCAQWGLTTGDPPCYAEQQAVYACGTTPMNGEPAPQE